MKKLITLTITAIMVAAWSVSAFAADVVVYSARKEHLIKPLFDAYTAETGVKVKYITGKAGALLERIKAEGANTSADLFITVDAGNLWHAAEEGILAPINSATLEKNVPSHLRDPQNRWVGLSVRARTIVYNKDKVSPEELSTYEALGEAKWNKRLLLRTSKKVYNQSLVASIIADKGEAETEKIVKSWVANLSVAPFSSDTKALEAVAVGVGDVAIVNTYYFGRLLKKNPDLPLAIFWPNQKTSGVHMNVSGAGVTANAKHKKEAVKLLEWLSSDKAQGKFASLNMEYPVNPEVKPDPIVETWGEFKGNPMNVSKYGEYQAEAIKLMDRAGYK
ncbi:iron(III) transport system substrate-binding protein [Maridesulfovibrio ferrireducens]|uniref:Iron(III) transport system substrate-binding protein n=1 Tax=Maridesulfovibrio ferrireducens TaxID=246191 RepID=A0A1G9IC12_9BACT|nr:extracellular solute-binding protein [Maridesulfovibrio ferrireducens]SDL22788.1 iron(III) transport system substrate-binding protein [Maridesulfovibrio ferrireducens]